MRTSFRELIARLLKPGALLVTLLLLWTLVAAPLALVGVGRAASQSVGAVTPPPGGTFASVTPRAHDKTKCLCASCPGVKGGKCCCDTSDDSTQTLAFRAVCDTGTDAVITYTFLPPMVLPQVATYVAAESLSAPRLLLCSLASVSTGHIGSPPDAPPRFLS